MQQVDRYLKYVSIKYISRSTYPTKAMLLHISMSINNIVINF